MNSNYYRRIITYNPDTQNYKVEIPMLNIEVFGDTESNAMINAREEEYEYIKKQSKIAKHGLTTTSEFEEGFGD